VFWVYASSAARFELAYRDIAAKVELPGRDDPKTDILQLVFNWLSDERNGRWLMIIDNADDDRVFSSSSAVLKSGVQAVEGGEVSALSAFLPQTQNGWILVTSRDLVAAMNLVGGREKVTQVEPMGMDDALALLNSRASIDDSSKEDAETLVQTLEYIPLAVTHAAAYIAVRKERFTISSYLELFHESEENQAHLLNKEEIKDIRRDVSVSNAVITTWQISFEQIRQTRPEAANLLSLMAMFDRHGIPAFLLYGGRSRLLFEDAVTPLTSFSLIKPHNINSSAQNARQHMFDMHGLVQLATRKWLGIRSQLETWEGRSIHTMATVFPRADNADRKNMESCQDLLPHARKTLAYIPRDVSVIPERATVAVNVGWYLYLSGGYSEAEKVCRRAYVEIHDLLGPKDMKTIASSALLAKVLISQSKYDEAQAKQEEALRVLQELSPHGDVHTYDVWARLGVICIHKGKYAEAEAYFRKAVEGYSMMAEPDVESTYQTQSQLAISLERQGKLEEAEKIHLEVVKRMQHSGRALNSDSIACMSNLAHLLSKQGQFTKAVQLYQRCTAAYEGIHGPAHPFTLITRGAVGVNLWLANKLPEATQVLRRNLEMEEQTLGTEHENVFMSAYNLALVLQDQSKYAEAETLFIRAIKGLAVIYKMGHPNLDLAMRNFDSLLAKQGRHQEAATLAKALEDPNMLSNTAELCSLIDRLRLGGNSRSSDDNR
jgi:tetratricopeptide (TPR) repeat protein